MKRFFIWFGSILLVLIVSVLVYKYVIDRGHTGPPTISEEVTFVAGPVDSDGYIDYFRAYDRERLKGIAAETNAGVDILRCIGPQTNTATFRSAWETLMDDLNYPSGPFFESIYDYAISNQLVASEISLQRYLEYEGLDSDGSDESRPEVFHVELEHALYRAFNPEQYAGLDRWLEEMQPSLDSLVRASRKQHCYLPLERPERGSLFDADMSQLQSAVDAAQALSLSARQHLYYDRVDRAVEETIALIRLERLIQMPVTGSSYFRTQFCEYAFLAERELVASRKLDVDQIKQLIEARNDRPEPRHASEIENMDRRMSVLSHVQAIHRGHDDPDHYFGGGVLSEFDIDLLMTEINKQFDENVSRLRDGQDKQNTRPQNNMVMTLNILFGGTKTAAIHNARVLGNDANFYYLFEEYGPRFDPSEISRTALAVELYRLENGKPPAALNDMVPQFIDKIPTDYYSGGQLKYKRTEDGYVIWSIGEDNIDNGGINFVDPEYDPSGSFYYDDVRVRVGSAKLNTADEGEPVYSPDSGG